MALLSLPDHIITHKSLHRHCDERAGASEEAIQAIARDGGKNSSLRPTKSASQLTLGVRVARMDCHAFRSVLRTMLKARNDSESITNELHDPRNNAASQ